MIITPDGSGRVLVGPPDFKSGVLAVEIGWWVRFPCASARESLIISQFVAIALNGMGKASKSSPAPRVNALSVR